MSKFLPEKVSDGLFKLKTYWSKPPKGYFVCYKEFVNLSLGFGALSFLSVLVAMATFDTAKDMMLHYQVSTGQVWLFGLISTLVGVIRAPILSICIDNCNSKYGKFKPFIMPAALVTAVAFCITPFIPTSWNDNVIGSFTMPAISWLGLNEPSVIKFTPAIIALWVLILIGQTANTFATQAMTGIEQTITPVSQERSTIAAIKGLISNIPGSIANMVPGVLLMFGAFEKVTINGAQIFPLEMNKILFPICSVLGIALMFFVLKGVKERVVLSDDTKNKVKFSEGVRDVSTNKYFWIVTIFMVFYGIRGYVNIVDPLRQFYFADNETLAGVVEFISKTLLMNAFAVGMLIGPFLVKKFGRRKVMLTACFVFLACAILQTVVSLASISPFLIILLTFIENLCCGFDFITVAIQSDALDYEQYRHGKRVEGFWQNYHNMILTIVGLFTALLPPMIAQWAGIGFGDDFASSMINNPEIRDKWCIYRLITGTVGALLCTLPMMFYDMTEKQHASIVKSLKIRAMKENYEQGKDLKDASIVEFKLIHDNAVDLNDTFILNKFNEFGDYQKILAMYDEAKVREDERFAKEEQEDFERNVELESKKLENKINKQKEYCVKKGTEFDEDAFIFEQVYHNRWLIKLEKYADILAKKQEDTAIREKETFEANVKYEEDKYIKSLQKAKEKSIKKDIAFDEIAFRKEFIYKSKFIIKLDENADVLAERDAQKAKKEREKLINEMQKTNKRLEKIKINIR